jgi:hypothetical protein
MALAAAVAAQASIVCPLFDIGGWQFYGGGNCFDENHNAKCAVAFVDF